MKLTLLVALCLEGSLVYTQNSRGRDDYNGKAVEFFTGDDKAAARAEMTPSPGCLEGDMELTPKQKEVYLAMREVKAENKMRVRREARNAFNVWPDRTFVYQYEAGLSPTIKRIFEEAIEIYREKTNIRFIEAVEGSYSGPIRPLTVQQSRPGCFATVGCPDGEGGGRINLEERSCAYLGTVLHEIGHALGRFHEQTRSDRSDYVTVVESNIRNGYEHNFQMADRPSLAPYDVQSIMHYSAYAFSCDGYSETIIAKNRQDTSKMGKQQMLSRLDVYTFNMAYNAYEDCPDDLPSRCLRGGVPNKHCTCDCLPTFKGPYCEIVDKPTECSHLYDSKSGEILSPGFPGLYPSNTECTYIIECDINNVINLEFPKFVIEDYECWYDKLEMMTGDLVSEVYFDEYCGNRLQGKKIVTLRNVAIIKFMSDTISVRWFKTILNISTKRVKHLKMHPPNETLWIKEDQGDTRRQNTFGKIEILP